MTIKNLYQYKNENGSTTVTTVQHNAEDKHCGVRLIADEGMELVKGDVRTCCIDTDSSDGWEEVEVKEVEETEE